MPKRCINGAREEARDPLVDLAARLEQVIEVVEGLVAGIDEVLEDAVATGDPEDTEELDPL